MDISFQDVNQELAACMAGFAAPCPSTTHIPCLSLSRVHTQVLALLSYLTHTQRAHALLSSSVRARSHAQLLTYPLFAWGVAVVRASAWQVFSVEERLFDHRGRCVRSTFPFPIAHFGVNFFCCSLSFVTVRC